MINKFDLEFRNFDILNANYIKRSNLGLFERFNRFESILDVLEYFDYLYEIQDTDIKLQILKVNYGNKDILSIRLTSGISVETKHCNYSGIRLCNAYCYRYKHKITNDYYWKHDTKYYDLQEIPSNIPMIPLKEFIATKSD